MWREGKAIERQIWSKIMAVPVLTELNATCSHHDLALRASIEILPINKINEPFLHIRKYG